MAELLCDCTAESVCARHVRRYLRQLGDLPALLAELEVNVARLNRGGRSAGGSGKGSAAPLPFDPAASELAAEISATVLAYAEAARLDMHAPQRYPGGWVFELAAAFLMRESWWVTDSSDGPELVRWLDGAICRARQLIQGRRPDRWFAGVCGAEVVRFDLVAGEVVPLVGFDIRCDARLFASAQEESVRCRACETVWPVTERRQQLVLFAQEFELPLKVIIGALPWLAGVGVKPATARSWTRSRLDRQTTFVVSPGGVAKASRLRRPPQLQPRSVGVDGAALYRVGDVIDLAVAAAERSVARVKLTAV